MKLAAGIGVLIAVASLALLVGGRSQRLSALEVRSAIAGLQNDLEFELMETRQYKGDAVLGSKIERKLRNLVGIRDRETPCVLEDYNFRCPAGTFSVQLLDREGEEPVVTVYGCPESSSASGKRIRAAFPSAHFKDQVMGVDQNTKK